MGGNNSPSEGYTREGRLLCPKLRLN